MGFAKDSLSTNAMGGTELMKFGLQSHITEDLLDNFQIFVSRVEEPFDETKIRIYWSHDLCDDPATEILRDGGWKNFHRLVFVSNWQMQTFIAKYDIPYSHCVVLRNAIQPFDFIKKPTDKIRIGYWSTPHRGLNILVPVFEKLSERYDNIELDVFSSFKLYGWEQRDEPFEALFDRCIAHDKINYHGSVPNEQIREYVKQAHILGYPSIWPETSCLTMIEAMAGGMLCVHPNYAGLPETSGGLTYMYQFQEELNSHANMFYYMLDNAINSFFSPEMQNRLQLQSIYANSIYSWGSRSQEWRELLTSMLGMPRELPKPEFVYRTS